MLSKQHYEAIAKILKPYNSPSSVMLQREREIAEKITLDLIDYFETDNERFQRLKFYKACGLELTR